VRLGAHAFLLQDYFVEAWVNNFGMQLTVDDLDVWWTQISGLDLAGRYGVPTPKPPKIEPWGMRVLHLIDPAGTAEIMSPTVRCASSAGAVGCRSI
jgi:hypothetical protein